jgi:hypothetical protein
LLLECFSYHFPAIAAIDYAAKAAAIMSAASIAAALNGKREGGEWRCPFPLCNRRTLLIRDGDLRLLMTCWGGCAGADGIAQLRRRRLHSQARGPIPACRPQLRDRWNAAAMRKRWRAPVPPVRSGKLAAPEMISRAGALSFMSFFDSDNDERKKRDHGMDGIWSERC